MDTQLAAFTTNDRIIGFHQNGSVPYAIEKKFWCNRVTLNGLGDLFVPRWVRSDCAIEALQLIINGNIITTFPVALCRPKMVTNSDSEEYAYEIPWKLCRMTPIHLFLTSYTEIVFKIIAQHQCVASLYGFCEFIPHQIQKTLLTNVGAAIDYGSWKLDRVSISATETEYRACSVFFQLDHHDHTINLIQGKNVRMLTLEGAIKGLFFNNVNLNHLNSLSIKEGGQIVINYDSFMLRHFVQSVTNDCFYLSLDGLPYDSVDRKLKFELRSGVITCSNDNDEYLKKVIHTGNHDLRLEIESKEPQEIELFVFRINALYYFAQMVDLCPILISKCSNQGAEHNE